MIAGPCNVKPSATARPLEQPSAIRFPRIGFSARRRGQRSWESHPRGLGKLSQALRISQRAPDQGLSAQGLSAQGLSAQGTELGQPPQQPIVVGKPTDLNDRCALASFQNRIRIRVSADPEVLVTSTSSIEVSEQVEPGHMQSGPPCRLCGRANRGADQNNPLALPALGVGFRQFLI
jgi:hypothetical protein